MLTLVFVFLFCSSAIAKTCPKAKCVATDKLIGTWYGYKLSAGEGDGRCIIYKLFEMDDGTLRLNHTFTSSKQMTLDLKYEEEDKEIIISLFNLPGSRGAPRRLLAQGNEFNIFFSCKENYEGIETMSVLTKEKSPSKNVTNEIEKIFKATEDVPVLRKVDHNNC